jgi:hypothetical protein
MGHKCGAQLTHSPYVLRQLVALGQAVLSVPVENARGKLKMK